LGCSVATFQIVHSQGANVHPNYHGVKQHPPLHLSSLLETNKKPCLFPYIPCERPTPFSRYFANGVGLTINMGTILHNGTCI